MERFGRFEFDPMNSPDDGGRVFSETQQPFITMASSDPVGLADALAEATLPSGGWPVFGAERTIFNLCSPPPECPSFTSLKDGAVQFLRANGVPPMRVAGLEWNHFIDSGGTNETWLPKRPVPRRDETSITPLAAGEVRVVAQLWAEPDSNMVLVRSAPDGQIEIVIDAKRSDEDPRRSQWVSGTEPDLFAAYLTIGYNHQAPTYRFDPQLEPFFPLPPPTI